MEKNWSQFFLSKELYTLACFGIQYFFPLFSLLFLYYKIGRKVLNRSRWRISSFRSNDYQSRMAAMQSQRKTMMLLGALVAFFAVLWLPWNLYNTLSTFAVIEFSMTDGFAYCHLVGMVSATMNPILYAALNENFKNVFAQVQRNVCVKIRRYFPVHNDLNTSMDTSHNGYMPVILHTSLKQESPMIENAEGSPTLNLSTMTTTENVTTRSMQPNENESPEYGISTIIHCV